VILLSLIHYIFAAHEHVFVFIIITSYDYKPLYQMHLIFLFFNEGSLSKMLLSELIWELSFTLKYCKENWAKSRKEKHEIILSSKATKKKKQSGKRKEQKQKVIKRESDSRQGELVLFSVDIPTTKKGSCFVDNRAGVASTCRWEVEATRTREIPLRRRKMTEMGKWTQDEYC